MMSLINDGAFTKRADAINRRFADENAEHLSIGCDINRVKYRLGLFEIGSRDGQTILQRITPYVTDRELYDLLGWWFEKDHSDNYCVNGGCFICEDY